MIRLNKIISGLALARPAGLLRAKPVKGINGAMTNNINYCFCKRRDNSTPQAEEERKGTDNKKHQDQEQQSNQNQRSWWRYINNPFSMVILGAVGGTTSYLLMQSNKKTPKKEEPKKTMQFGGEWSLTGTDNTPFGSKELRGSYYLMYFGFSHCPDVCPSSLTYLSQVEQHFRTLTDVPMKVVFVSVDPARDTPSVLKQYLLNFNPRFLGVTGQGEGDQRLKNCMKAFKVYAQKIPVENGSNYNVDHTSLVYLMGRNSEFVNIVNTSLPEKEAAQQLLKHIESADNKIDLL